MFSLVNRAKKHETEKNLKKWQMAEQRRQTKINQEIQDSEEYDKRQRKKNENKEN